MLAGIVRYYYAVQDSEGEAWQTEEVFWSPTTMRPLDIPLGKLKQLGKCFEDSHCLVFSK